jgi:hypothetical protein
VDKQGIDEQATEEGTQSLPQPLPIVIFPPHGVLGLGYLSFSFPFSGNVVGSEVTAFIPLVFYIMGIMTA